MLCPSQGREANCSAEHTSKAAACPSFLPVHRVSAVKGKQRGEANSLTQNNLRNCQSHQWSQAAITSGSRRSSFVALPTRTQAGRKPQTYSTARQPQKGPCASALSTPRGQTYPVQSCICTDLSRFKNRPQGEPVLFQNRRL